MSNLTVQNSSHLQRLSDAARRMRTGERMLKFKQGEFTINDDPVSDTREFLAYPDQCGHGWTLFLNKEMIEERVTLISETEEPPRPDSHSDMSKWPIGPNGKKADPWSFQIHLPLCDVEADQFCVFKTSTMSGQGSVGALIADFLRDPTSRPVIVLKTDRFKNKAGGWTDFPVFEVVRREPIMPAAPMPAAPVSKIVKPVLISSTEKPVIESNSDSGTGGTVTNDMDDDIPFAPEVR
jgi:hypothetical protein